MVLQEDARSGTARSGSQSVFSGFRDEGRREVGRALTAFTQRCEFPLIAARSAALIPTFKSLLNQIRMKLVFVTIKIYLYLALGKCACFPGSVLSLILARGPDAFLREKICSEIGIFEGQKVDCGLLLIREEKLADT